MSTFALITKEMRGIASVNTCPHPIFIVQVAADVASSDAVRDFPVLISEKPNHRPGLISSER